MCALCARQYFEIDGDTLKQGESGAQIQDTHIPVLDLRPEIETRWHELCSGDPGGGPVRPLHPRSKRRGVRR